MDLSVRVGSLQLKNPVMTASGTFGYGMEFDPYMDLNDLGAIVVKGLSLKPRRGNPPPRITETSSGMLNAIGLQNIGVEAFIREKLPFLKKFRTPVVANALGNTVEDYAEICRILSRTDGIAAVEVNVSCPNVKEGGIHFATEPAQTARVTQAVRNAIGDFPLIIKLSPNVTDIIPFARACQDSGADAVSLVNTFVGTAIDVETMQPRLFNVIGGLSGPAIKPLAQRLVMEVCRKVDIPVIGIGGIMNATDALEYLALGACAIQVGTASFIRPDTSVQVLKGIQVFCKTNGISRIQDFIGEFLRRNSL